MLADLLQISPLCYHAALLSMEIDSANGRSADALRKYERYARHLVLEFDEIPPDELRDAYETLKSSPTKRPQFRSPRRRQAYVGNNPWRKTSSDAPVIAVIPFRYMGNRELGDGLAAAMSEDITLMLSGCRWFKVMSRSATHSVLSNEPFVINNFVQRTGADYLIYGAVVERGDNWSVTVELADAASGIINWAKRYDAASDKIIFWARDVCPLIVAALDPALAESESKFSHKPTLSATGSTAAYQRVVTGYRNFYSGNWIEALSEFTNATEQDETYAHAHAMMAVTIYLDAQVNRKDHWREQMQEAEKSARRALEIDPSEAKACNILGQILDWQGDHDKSLHFLNRAVSLNPSFAWASTGHSYHSVMTGAFDEAKTYIQTALRLRVGDSGLGLCLPARALADLHLGNLEDALGTAHWATRLQPDFWLGRQVLAACLLASGNESAAEESIIDLRQDYKGLSSGEFAGWFPYGSSDIDTPILDTLQHFGWN
jgi:adenylate cyclase